ncbi:MAG: FISUMP domain-containing protein [Bacteroidales bacterium]
MKKILFTIVAFSALLLFSCKEEGPGSSYTIGLNPPTDAFIEDGAVQLSSDRNVIYLTVDTRASVDSWDVISPTSDQWFTASKTDDGRVVVTVAENNTDDMRSSYAKVIVGSESGTLRFSQFYKKILNFNPSSLNVGAARDEYEAFFESNVNYTELEVNLDENCDWIEDIEILADRVLFTVLRNPSTTDIRSAQMVLNHNETETTLNISQNRMSGYSYIIPIASLDFSQYPSYIIYDDVHDVGVGEIYKEYLYKANEITGDIIVRKSAIVAYPYTASGELDLSNGFVASDGGSIIWNAEVTTTTAGADMIINYKGGSLSEAPETIYMPAGSTKMSERELESEELPTAITATLKPNVVIDFREGPPNTQGETTESFTYGIVKIASQYWMSSNLATTRFSNGENIPTNFANPQWVEINAPIASAGCLVSATGTSSTFLDANDGSGSGFRIQYGCLYNYPALINDVYNVEDIRDQGPFTDNISPNGWKVPANSDFETLWKYLVQAYQGVDFSRHTMVELYASATGDLGNITGFSAKGTRSRGVGTGGYNTGTFYRTIDYIPGTSPSSRVIRINGNGNQAVFLTHAFGVGDYVRLIRDPNATPSGN